MCLVNWLSRMDREATGQAGRPRGPKGRGHGRMRCENFHYASGRAFFAPAVIHPAEAAEGPGTGGTGMRAQ